MATIEDVPVTPVNKSRKRKAKEDNAKNPEAGETKRHIVIKKVDNPIQLLNKVADGVPVATMKKAINGWQSSHSNFTVPKELRKILRTVSGPHATLEDKEVLEQVSVLYKKGLTLDAVKFMGLALLYYEDNHNIELRKRDLPLIERSAKTPDKVAHEKIAAVYTNYLRDLEETSGYYARHVRHNTKPKEAPKREREVVVAKPTNRHLPYNLFIQQQWTDRREEFQAIIKDHGITEVMKRLSVEWKTNPQLKVDFQSKCDVLNSEKAIVVPVAEASVEEAVAEIST